MKEKFESIENKIIILEKFLGPERKEYKEIIDLSIKEHHDYPKKLVGRGRSDYYTSAVSHWVNMIAKSKPSSREIKYIDFFKSKLKGEILLDLAGGYGDMVDFADFMGARVYINVDLNPPFIKDKHEINPLIDISQQYEYMPEMQVINVKADMLDFISRCPDNSLNVTVNNIDSYVIGLGSPYGNLRKEFDKTFKHGLPSTGDDIKKLHKWEDEHRKLTQKYLTFLMEEIIRATKKNGIIFGCVTNILDHDYKEHFFRNPNENRVISASGMLSNPYERGIYIKK